MNLDIFHHDLQPLIHFFHSHPHFAGIFSFFVVFGEAMAVIGVVIPGSITMTAIGILIGSGVIPSTSTFIWAICGAILGDYLSYLIGVYYKDRLHKIWPFRKHPKLLIKGEKFFAAHGGKSIIIGRFVGPMRAMIPMVAGMLKMPMGRFLLAAIPSASIWAVGYMLPGVVIGAVAIQLPPKIATQFLLWIMLAVIVTWTITWILQHFLKRILRFCDRKIKKLWWALENSRAWHWLPDILRDPHRPDHHQQLTLLFSALVCALVFFILLINVVFQGPLTYFNEPLYHLLQSIRTHPVDELMLGISFIAEPKALLIAQTVFILWLASKRYWYTMWHALAILVLCFGSMESFKHLLHIQRPNPHAILSRKFLSFPSGHTTAGVAVYGFLAMLAARQLKVKFHWLPYALAAVLMVLVIFSRLYLGAHWLTDVSGGAFLGLSLLFLVTISYRRRHTRKVSLWKNSLMAFGIFAVVLALYANTHFQYQLTHYYGTTPITQTIELKLGKANLINQALMLFRFIGIIALVIRLTLLICNG